MKNLLTVFCAFFFISNLFAQIKHTDYGDGWVIPLNANVTLDINNNGIPDFYVNQKEGDLSFTPISEQGCLIGTGYGHFTSFGTKEGKIFEEGEHIRLFGGTDYYIEDEEISFYTTNVDNGVFADGWTDLEDYYIGIGLFSEPSADGWMKISIDAEAQTLIIKEIAYVSTTNGGIEIGQTELLTSVDPLEELTNVAVSPNPANDFVHLDFNYSGDKVLSVSILDNIGQRMHSSQVESSSTSLDLDTSNLAQGIYIIRFETEDGIYIEKLSIQK